MQWTRGFIRIGIQQNKTGFSVAMDRSGPGLDYPITVYSVQIHTVKSGEKAGPDDRTSGQYLNPQNNSKRKYNKKMKKKMTLFM